MFRPTGILLLDVANLKPLPAAAWRQRARRASESAPPSWWTATGAEGWLLVWIRRRPGRSGCCRRVPFSHVVVYRSTAGAFAGDSEVLDAAVQFRVSRWLETAPPADSVVSGTSLASIRLGLLESTRRDAREAAEKDRRSWPGCSGALLLQMPVRPLAGCRPNMRDVQACERTGPRTRYGPESQ